MPDVNEQIKVRMDKLNTLQEAGKDPFQITKYDVTEHTSDIKDNFDEYDGKSVSVAGRLMAKRVMGKASFCNVADLKGNIQLYVARDAVGEEPYAAFKKFDIGDIVGVKGEVFRTQKGEISIHVSEITLLTKSLQVLPEKYHGLKDTDQRYRQRYVDLIVNPEVKDTFVKRSQIIKEIRNFLDAQGFMEVETPMLVANAGGAAARPFTTHYNALDEDINLRISLELYLKRLIVGGMERVYEIGRVFRNEGVDTRHNPEFTLMELYQAYTDYYGMMDLAENMYRTVCEKVNGTAVIKYGDVEIDLSKPFERITMLDAVKKYSGVDFTQIKSDEEAKAVAKEHNIEFEERHKKGDILNLFFEEYVEEKLVQPTFVMDHPVDISPLTKRKPDAPEYTERFELFITGREMANAYSELNDPIDQRARFEAQEALKAAGDEEANSIDEDFLNALAYGMPPTGGIGFGIDRMVMLLTDSAAIRDVLLFPTMKSQGAAKNEANNAAQATPVAAKVVVPVEGTAAPAKVEIDFSNVEVEPLFEDMVDFDTFSKSDFRAVKVKECEAV
ncbi:MAG: lysine--tRNA ligase, partial [Lachnospira sp.]